jgi:hypothetical protein
MAMAVAPSSFQPRLFAGEQKDDQGHGHRRHVDEQGGVGGDGHPGPGIPENKVESHHHAGNQAVPQQMPQQGAAVQPELLLHPPPISDKQRQEEQGSEYQPVRAENARGEL